MRSIGILAIILSLFLTGTSPADFPSRPDPDKGPTIVRFHAFLVDLDGINSAEQTFDVNLYCELRWHDSRLANQADSDRILPLEALWSPGTLLVNQVFIRKSLPEVATVSPDGDVVYRQQYVGKLSQALSLRDFPTDVQELNIQFSSLQQGTDQIIYQIDDDSENGLSDKLSIPDWKTTEWTLTPESYQPTPSATPLPGALFTITTERESGYYLIKVLIPLFLILIMASTVFWIHPKDSGVQISVATSTMLTLIAYRFAIGSALPDIPYLTRMDIFILACTVLVVLCLVEVVITSRLAAIDKLEPALRLDRVMRFAFPATVVLITFYSFYLF